VKWLLHWDRAYCISGTNRVAASDVNKDLTLKAKDKDKDHTLKANDQDKD